MNLFLVLVKNMELARWLIFTDFLTEGGVQYFEKCLSSLLLEADFTTCGWHSNSADIKLNSYS